MHTKLTLTLAVTKCTCCGGQHGAVEFMPLPGNKIAHRGVCPKTGRVFVMESDPEVYERMLTAAGGN